MKYRLVVGSHGRFEGGRNVVYRNGDPIELTEEEAAVFGERVDPWTDDVVSDSDTDTAAEAPAKAAAPIRQKGRPLKHPKRRG